jgi:hypothetical protein
MAKICLIIIPNLKGGRGGRALKGDGHKDFY